MDGRRGRPRGGGRARARPRDPHRAAARRERAADRRAGVAAPGRAGGHERARAATPCSRASSTQVAELLRADAADCYLLDPERDMLRCAAVYGLSAELLGFEFPAGRGLTGRAMRAGGRCSPTTTSASARRRSRSGATRGSRARSSRRWRWGGEVRGVSAPAAATRARTFNQADAELLEAFANLASLALRNAESFERAHRQARIQRGFYRIAAVLGAAALLRGDLRRAGPGRERGARRRPRRGAVPSAGGCELAARTSLPGAAERSGPASATRPARCVAAARDGRVLAARELEGDERFERGVASAALESGYGALLAVPVEAPRTEEARARRRRSSARSGASRTTTSSSRATSRAPRAARSSGASCSRPSARSRALAQQLARTGSAARDRARPGGRARRGRRQAPALLGADAAVDPPRSRATSSSLSAGSGEGARGALGARVAVDRLARRRRRPVARAGRGLRRREDERRSPSRPAARRGLRRLPRRPARRARGRASTACSRSTAAARASGARRRSRRSRPSPANASAALSNAELYQSVALEKERSVAILANIADGIVAVDRDGKVVLWNAAAERITGVPADGGARPHAGAGAAARARVRRATRRPATGCSRSAAAARRSGSR